jgi:hypothetical protein
MTNKFQDIVLKTHLFITAIPGCFTLVFISYLLHVRLNLGRWPLVVQDNPTNLFLDIHEWSFVILLYTTLVSIIIWPILSAFLFFVKRYKLLLMRSFVFTFPLILSCLAIITDKTGVVEWFFD